MSGARRSDSRTPLVPQAAHCAVRALASGLVGIGIAGLAIAGERTYVVAPGDSLSAIAARWTGDPQRWEELYRANRDQIKDPSLLYPGQRLVILDRWPELERGAPDEDERATE